MAASERSGVERHLGPGGADPAVAYEITGKAEYLDKANAVVNALRAAQLNPYGGGAADGGIWHSLLAHEGVSLQQGGAAAITSPWMSALLVEILARTHYVTGSGTVSTVIGGRAGARRTKRREGHFPSCC